MVDDSQPTLTVFSLERTQENCWKRKDLKRRLDDPFQPQGYRSLRSLTKVYNRLPFNFAT